MSYRLPNNVFDAFEPEETPLSFWEHVAVFHLFLVCFTVLYVLFDKMLS